MDKNEFKVGDFLIKSVPISVKNLHDDDEEKNILIAYASTFGNEDLHGDVIAKDAFNSSINKINSEGIPFLDSHSVKTKDTLGTVISAEVDSRGLKIKVKFVENVPSVAEAIEKVKQGHVKFVSIGFILKEGEMVKTVEGRDVFLIRDMDLKEVSLTPIPANPEANILAVKRLISDDKTTLDLNELKIKESIEEDLSKSKSKKRTNFSSETKIGNLISKELNEKLDKIKKTAVEITKELKELKELKEQEKLDKEKATKIKSAESLRLKQKRLKLQFKQLMLKKRGNK